MTGLFPATPARVITVDELVRALPSYRWPVGVEKQFQAAVEEWLHREGIAHQREFFLGERGTIDFYLPDGRIGLELKVKGSSNDIIRQLHRYAQAPEIDALVLLSSHAAHALAFGPQLDPVICGKPVHIVTAWAGGL